MKVFVAGASGAIGRRLSRCSSRPATTWWRRRAGRTARAAPHASARPRWSPTGSTATRSSRRSSRAEPEVVVHQMTGARRRDRLPQLRRGVRAHQPAAHRGHRPPGRGRARRRRAARRRPELRQLELRAHAAARSKTETDPLDPDPPRDDAADARGDPPPRGGGHAQTAAFDGVALRYGEPLRPGTELRRRRRPRRAGAPAAAADRRRRRRRVVVRARRRRRGRDARGDRARPARRSTTSPTTSPRPPSIWLPELAEAPGAKPPRHVPAWLGRLAAGEAAVSMFTEIRGADNARPARAALDAARTAAGGRASGASCGSP